MIIIMIILLATSFSFTKGADQRNLLLISSMFISPLLNFSVRDIKLQAFSPLVVLCFLMIVFSVVLHPESIRWSTILYSCMFCLNFFTFTNVFGVSGFSMNNLEKLLRYLIYAYVIVLIIQQFCVLTGLPIFNISNYDIKEKWKLNSLMTEPSHSAKVIPVLMYLYLQCQGVLFPKTKTSLKESFLQNKWIWYSFIWCILTMGSATAFIFVFIVLLKYINFKSSIHYFLIFVFLFSIFFATSDYTPIKRVRNVAIALCTLDENAIIKADGSASYRIVPSLRAAKEVEIFSVDGMFGHGVDANMNIVKQMNVSSGAGVFSMWIDYGFLVTLIWWIYTFRLCHIKREWTSIVAWFFCVFMAGGINTQMVWLVITLMYSFKSLSNDYIEYANIYYERE